MSEPLSPRSLIVSATGEASGYFLTWAERLVDQVNTNDATASEALTQANLQDTGWTEGTGTANKGAFATYAGQNVSAAYVEAEAQATDDAVKAVSQRVLALEEALRAVGKID